MNLTLFTAVSMMLCFESVAKAVLITHSVWAAAETVLAQCPGSLLPRVSRLGVGMRLREGTGRTAGMK